MRPVIDYRPARVNGQGIGRYVRELVRAMEHVEGLDPALFGPTWTRPSFNQEQLGAKGLRSFAPRLPSKGVTRSLSALGLGVERLFRGGADLVHHTQYRRLPTRLPEVAMVHDLVFLDSSRYMQGQTANRMSTFVREAARRCKVLVTPSETVADEVAERLDVPRERVVATPLGVDHVLRAGPADPWSPDPGEGPYVFTAARMETRKNLGLVLRALESLPAPRPRWRIAGIQGEGAEAFLSALSVSPARDSVTLLGHVTEAELRRELLGAAAFVLVPLDEGFGLAPLEAMALGVATITSAVPVVQEVCGGGALLVDPEDHVALTRGLSRVTGEGAFRHELIERGLQRAAGFTWERTAARTLEAYRMALGG